MKALEGCFEAITILRGQLIFLYLCVFIATGKLLKFTNKNIINLFVKKAVTFFWDTLTSVFGPASLWETLSLSERPCLSVRGPVSLCEVRPLCDKPSLTVRGRASLCENWPLCYMPGLYTRGLASLWEAFPLCERPGLSVKSPASLWEAWSLCFRPKGASRTKLQL